MAFDDYIERPALVNWMSAIGGEGEVQEIEVTSEELVGRTVSEIDPELPTQCLIALVSRDGETMVPDGDFRLERGDHITFLGDNESVAEAIAFAHPTGS
jgi:Trk K+ transport system NAD-binding subunit